MSVVKNMWSVLCGALLLLGAAGESIARQNPQEKRKLRDNDRAVVESMLHDMREAIQKYYYDPTFRGVDLDARYKSYQDRVKSAETLSEATRAVAAYMAILDDSHTIFLPSPYNFRFDYDYRLQLYGDQCFLTDVRPGSDAAQKLHAGDQVLKLDGYSVNRKDLEQLEYYLRLLAPHRDVDFQLRDTAGSQRHEVVTTKIRNWPPVYPRSFGEFQDEMDKLRHAERSRHAEVGDTLVWKLPTFTAGEENAAPEVTLARKHRVLILDLRGNSGGAVSDLRFILGSLFDHDVEVARRISRKEEKPMVAKSRGSSAFGGKLIVLVDSRSASAAELLARVVQLEHRGTVIGDVTSGSVMEASLYPYAYNGVRYAAEITTSDLVMSDGKSLEKVGVVPDILVLPTAEDLAQRRDPVLARALELAGQSVSTADAGKLLPYEWQVE